MKKLTDLSIQAAKPRDTPYKLADGEGLYLLVGHRAKATPRASAAARHWRVRYRFGGREKIASRALFDTIRVQRMNAANEKLNDIGCWAIGLILAPPALMCLFTGELVGVVAWIVLGNFLCFSLRRGA